MLKRILAVLAIWALTMGSAFAQSDGKAHGVRVLILPFDGSSAGEYAYLVDGIGNMLASRLAAKEGVHLVDYSLQEAEIKKMMAAGQESGDIAAVYARLQTDYLITGALYATNIGLKVQVGISSAGANSPHSISSLMKDEEKVITAVGTLVEEIGQKIFATPGGEAALPDNRTVKADDIGGFRTEHPEKMYKKGALGGGSIVDAEGENGSVTAKGVKRSTVIPAVVVSMDVGDLDNNGEKEIVFASHTALQVFHYAEGRFQKMAERSFPPTFKIHALNIADLDKDGRSEIFVSANEGLDLSSMILGWSAEGGLKVLSNNIRSFIRPVLLPGEGFVLAGQSGNAHPEQGFVQPGLFKMTVGPGYTSIGRGAKIPLPASVNLFDFIWADLDANGTVETVAIDRNEKLLVFDNQKNLLWVSDKDFGGSRNYLGAAKMQSIATDNRDRVVRFVPTKLLAHDVNGDGRLEIVIGRNKRVSSPMFENTRRYDGGTIACLAWDSSSMQELWRTNTIAGYIADYSISSAGETSPTGEGDRQVQLYVGQVPVNILFGLLAADESKLLVYEINVKGKGKSGVK